MSVSALARATLTEPVAERVFFAGDACTVETYGSINGAWDSAVAAARRIAASRASAS